MTPLEAIRVGVGLYKKVAMLKFVYYTGLQVTESKDKEENFSISAIFKIYLMGHSKI